MNTAFLPLAAANFLATFNSNFMKNALVIMVVAAMPLKDAEAMSSFVSAIFMIPMIFITGLGGQLADRHGKAWMARLLKGFEFVAMLVALTGFIMNSYWVVLAGVVLLQVVASLFGPVRSSLIPALVPPKDVPTANAWVEGLTFISMISALAFLGFVFAIDGWLRVAAVSVVAVVALASFIAIRFVPQDDKGSEDVVVDANLLRGTWRTLSMLRGAPEIRPSVFILGWSWFMASLALSTIPAMVARFEGDASDMSAAMVAFGVVGTLSVQIAARVLKFASKEQVRAFGLIGLVLSGGAVGLALAAFGSASLLMTSVCLLAAAHAFVMIPSATTIQTAVEPSRRARISAASNIVNALFMAGGGLIVAALQAVGFGLAAIYAVAGMVALLLLVASLKRSRVKTA